MQVEMNTETLHMLRSSLLTACIGLLGMLVGLHACAQMQTSPVYPVARASGSANPDDTDDLCRTGRAKDAG